MLREIVPAHLHWYLVPKQVRDWVRATWRSGEGHAAANPKRYDVHAAVGKLRRDSWSTPRYRDRIALGDRVWLQIVGPDRPGIYYVASIVSLPYERADAEFGRWHANIQWDFRIDLPLLRPELLGDPGLDSFRPLRGFQGTLVPLPQQNAGISAGESFRVSASGILADQATIWSRRGVPAGLGFLPGLNQSTALGLSGSGSVSGESGILDYTNGTFLTEHAFVWPGHGPLLTLPVPHRPYARSGSEVHQISDNGTVVGQAGPARGVWHAYVWTCAFRQAFLPPPPTAQSGTAGPSDPGRRLAGPARWAAFRHFGLLAGDRPI